MARRAVLVSMAPDATVADVVQTLDRPVEYIRRILEKLEHCRRVHGDAQVRIGVRGQLECPNYLVEYLRTDPKTKGTSVHPVAAYSGSTHRELAAKHIEDAIWSPEEMNITAVSALIGRLRNQSG